MANYIGNQPSYGEFKRLDSISSSFDGSTTTFNLTYNSVSTSVGDASQLIVSLNGIIQEPLNSYTLGVGGSSIVFASAPASGDTCFIMYIGGAGGTVTTISDGVVTASKLDASLKDYYEDEFTADGSTTDFTLSRESVGVNQLLVTIDGIVQPTSAYTASGTTLTISPALPNGTNIRVVHMGVKAGVFVPQAGSVGLNELDLTGVDTRYYTQTAADATFETISNVALKAPIASPSFTGNITVGPDTSFNYAGNNGIQIQSESGNNSGLFLETNGGTIKTIVTSDTNASYANIGTLTNHPVRFITNDAPRVFIDTSGNFFVKTTTEASDDVGHALLADGAAYHTADNRYVGLFNRKTSNGELVQFRKDNSIVGTIGVEGGDSIYIGNGDAGIKFSGGANVVQPFNPSAVTASDDVISLGTEGARFKNIYLAGGVFLGGTTNANFFNDYEEGTWNPTIDIEGGGTISGTNKYGFYTKAGRIVTIHFGILVTGTSGASGSNALQFSNVPFTASSGVAEGFPISIRLQSATLAVNGWYGRLYGGSTGGRIEALSTNGTGLINSSSYIGNGTRIDVTIVYQTDA